MIRHIPEAESGWVDFAHPIWNSEAEALADRVASILADDRASPLREMGLVSDHISQKLTAKEGALFDLLKGLANDGSPGASWSWPDAPAAVKETWQSLSADDRRVYSYIWWRLGNPSSRHYVMLRVFQPEFAAWLGEEPHVFSMGLLRQQWSDITDEHPRVVARRMGRTYWEYREAFYWESEGFDSDEVKSLIDAREVKKARAVKRAQAVVDSNKAGAPRRELVPEEVRAAVWHRDGAACVRCGSDRDLEYDHIIPVSMGGANTERNIQLLCMSCNREKGANLA